MTEKRQKIESAKELILLDQQALRAAEDLSGLAEILALSCGVPWAGILVGVHTESVLCGAYGPGASNFSRSPQLCRLARGARDVVVLTSSGERGIELAELASANLGGQPIGLLVIAPVFGDGGKHEACVWIADRRRRELHPLHQRALELICDEVRLRVILRQRVLEKLRLFEELRKTEESLQRVNKDLILARDRALDGERSKAVFLTNLGHQLRTPLNAIIGFTEIALDDVREMGREDLKVTLEHVLQAGHRLAEMIENTLRVARVDTKRMPLYLETFDLGHLLTEVAETVRPLAIEHNNELTLRFSPHLGSIYADQTKVRQIVYNLLSNACKFTENGKVSINAVRLHRGKEEYVRIVIADTGKGIALDQLEKLFEEFSSTTSDSSPAVHTGLGVGLAVANRFCRMMNGNIRVASKPGVGSRFTVTLPAIVKVEEKSEHSSSSSLKAVSEVIANPSPTALRVLVIDSDPETRDLIESVLKKNGFCVLAAANARDALSLAARENLAAVSLDVNLPDEDGWVLLSKLRTLPSMVNVPVLLITETIDQNLAFELGATEILSKPVSPNAIAAVFRKFLKEGPGEKSK